MPKLTQQEAAHRSESINSGLSYNFYIHLEKGKSYNGVTEVTFEAKKITGLFLDFDGKEIVSLKINENAEINDKSKIEELWQEGKLNLTESQLKVGKNTVWVGFKNEYNTDGNGLHTFLDADDKQYIYVQSEPFWHNRVVPIFDQPDLNSWRKIHQWNSE